MNTVPTPALEFHEVHPQFAAGAWGSFIVLEWRSQISLAGLQEFEAFSVRAREMYKKRRLDGTHCMLVIVPAVAATPEPAVREAMAAGMKRNGESTSSIAMVYEAQGLQATVLRSIAAAITLMARQKAPTRVFATLDDAIAWQTKYHHLTDHAAGLREVADQLRKL